MKKRVVSAIVLIPVLGLALLEARVWGSVSLSMFIAIAAAYELVNNTKLVPQRRLRIYTYLAAGTVPLCCCTKSVFGVQVLIFVFCVLLFGEAMLSKSSVSILNIGVCLAAGVLLPFIYSGIVRLGTNTQNRMLILIPFVIAFMSDSGAYFTGLAFGKHHFASYVSPNKTLEGVAGGVVWGIAGMLVYALIVNRCSDTLHANYLLAVLYGGSGSLAATFGDLCFSYIKRQVGIKDFGKLIPGHGGILDRFDSMTMVMTLTEILLTAVPVIQ